MCARAVARVRWAIEAASVFVVSATGEIKGIYFLESVLKDKNIKMSELNENLDKMDKVG